MPSISIWRTCGCCCPCQPVAVQHGGNTTIPFNLSLTWLRATCDGSTLFAGVLAVYNTTGVPTITLPANWVQIEDHTVNIPASIQSNGAKVRRVTAYYHAAPSQLVTGNFTITPAAGPGNTNGCAVGIELQDGPILGVNAFNTQGLSGFLPNGINLGGGVNGTIDLGLMSQQHEMVVILTTEASSSGGPRPNPLTSTVGLSKFTGAAAVISEPLNPSMGEAGTLGLSAGVQPTIINIKSTWQPDFFDYGFFSETSFLC